MSLLSPCVPSHMPANTSSNACLCAGSSLVEARVADARLRPGNEEVPEAKDEEEEEEEE